MKRSGPLKRRSRVNPRNTARRQRETARAYGPAERRAWMVAMDCLTCRAAGPSQQSHLRSRSGAGRKGDAKHNIPQCASCHALYPQRSKWLERFPLWTDEALNAAAAQLDAEWRAYERQG